MGRRAIAARSAAAIAGLLVTAACTGTSRSVSGFCTRLAKDRDSLVAAVSDPAGVRKAVASYESLDAVAPEAIRDQWHQVTVLVEKAATLDPAKTDDTAALVTDAFASSSAVEKTTAYAKATCNVELSAPTTGPTTAPATTGTTATTSAAPPSSSR
jgi:hypothetical protein